MIFINSPQRDYMGLCAIALTHCKYTKYINTTYIYAIFFLLTCINFDSII